MKSTLVEAKTALDLEEKRTYAKKMFSMQSCAKGKDRH